ncbi:MAG: phosphatidylserine decarboxylase [bacterium]
MIWSMGIAREGFRLLLPLLGLVLLFVGGGWLLRFPALQIGGGILFLLGLFLLFFFRDPARRSPKGTGLVLAPCDGKVILAEEAADGRPHGRVAIFMSLFDVHVNRCPITGVVRTIERRKGRFHHAAAAEATRENASVRVDASADFGGVTWIQVAGMLARRISCRLSEGQQLLAGERFGLIYFGSRMEVLLPSQVRLQVKAGQRVKAGSTILAEAS